MLKNYDENNSLVRNWPEECPWPAPLWGGYGFPWDEEDADLMPLDEEAVDLLRIKEFYDDLVICGRLNDDYTWNEYYEEDSDDEFSCDVPEDFVPDLGEEYWTDRFEYQMWEDDFSEHLNLIKIDPAGFDTLIDIQSIIQYSFVNENLLRQAFTRRSFATEYGLSGCNEELELLGDTILNTVVTREMFEHLTVLDSEDVEAPFTSRYTEGDLTKIRRNYVSKEFLSARSVELGLDRFILYGHDETPSESSREDVIEALIGAVTIDCGWDWDVIEMFVDRLLCIQMNDPGRYLKKTYFETFNAWHQKHFGETPDYTIDGFGPYYCVLRFSVPENDRGIWPSQLVDARGDTRSEARERAAELAYWSVVSKGLWTDLRNSGITPSLEDSINQLQELYQKKYLDSKPEYEFTEEHQDQWLCDCNCSGIRGWGRGPSKVQAKKRAAYMILQKLFK